MQTEFLKLEEFLIGLQRSWKEVTKAINIAKETMKRQYDKKRQNLQGLKEEDNIWLEAKNIHSNRPSKKLDQKQYRPFKFLKAIGQEVFWLKLPEGWIIHDVFNENLLIRCKEPQYKEQHVKPALLPDIINKKEEYKVEEIRKH